MSYNAAASPGDEIHLENVQPKLESQLRGLKDHHHWDPNLPDEIAEEVKEALTTTDSGIRAQLAHELLDNSPYPEVRAAVSNIDEGGYSNTIRAWCIGIIFATIGPGMNMLFSLRQPAISIPSYVAQVCSYPIGKAWEKFVPSIEFRFFGIDCNLNPGPFTKKEHAVIVLMANACFGGAAYATDIITAQRVFYGQHFGWAFELLLCISSQTLGFGMSGFFHKYLVTPASMIWPGNLINTAIFNTFHDDSKPGPDKTNGWKINRYRFFLWVMLGSFVWYWFPGYIAPFLSIFAWPTWIKPESVIINQLFGGSTGISLLPMTFDWTQISAFNYSPLISPWFAIFNTLVGTVLWYWIVTPAIHYSGLFYSEYLPISDSGSYDNTGHRFNVSRILTPEYTFDVEKYRNYSPLFLSTTFMQQYGLSFASVIAVLVHVVLFHGREIWDRFRNIGREEEEDVHSRLMSQYKQVPLWWYGVITVTMLGTSLGVSLGYPTHLTWWAFFIALIIPIIWWIPIGMVFAATNITIGLNVITEFIIGYMQPGRPIAMILFKTYGYITMNQRLTFNSDMKMGHYMKIPPRVTFTCQLIAGIWGSIVQIAVMNWAFGSIEGVCTPHQENHYTCPNGRVFFNASIIWGVIGPKRMFSAGQMYSPLMFFWLAGLLFPIALYLVARKYPKSLIRYISAPIIFGGTGLLPPATPLNYLSWCFVGYLFNRHIRNRFRGWWMTYNYIFSAGLDIGLAFSTILIFLTLNLTKTEFPDWWGKTIASGTLDFLGTAVQKKVAPGETFGPSSW